MPLLLFNVLWSMCYADGTLSTEKHSCYSILPINSCLHFYCWSTIHWMKGCRRFGETFWLFCDNKVINQLVCLSIVSFSVSAHECQCQNVRCHNVIFTNRNAVWEGNVFGCVCLSISMFMGRVKFVHFVQILLACPPPPHLLKLVHYGAHTSISKRTVVVIDWKPLLFCCLQTWSKSRHLVSSDMRWDIFINSSPSLPPAISGSQVLVLNLRNKTYLSEPTNICIQWHIEGSLDLGAPTPKGGNLLYGQILWKNCMKMRTNGLWSIQTELKQNRGRDQEKMVCTIICLTFALQLIWET